MNREPALRRERAADVTAAAYNSAADRFDDPALGFWDTCAHRTIELARLRRGSRVLDVGCGTGASALRAARLVGPRGRVVGIDLAEGLLRQARCKALAEGLDNVEFRVGDMTRFDCADESFDTVVCVFSLFFVDDMARQLRRLWHFIRPGGRLAVTTWGPGLFEPARSLFWSAVRDVRPELDGKFRPWERLTRRDSLRELFLAAQLPVPVISLERSTQPLAAPEDWWTIACGTGFRWTIDRLSNDEARHVRQRNVAALAAAGTRRLCTDFICAVARKPFAAEGPLLYWDPF